MNAQLCNVLACWEVVLGGQRVKEMTSYPQDRSMVIPELWSEKISASQWEEEIMGFPLHCKTFETRSHVLQILQTSTAITLHTVGTQ